MIIDWAWCTDEEVMEAVKRAPRIFGPWREWTGALKGSGESRDEIFPGPSWKTRGMISVQPHTGCKGFSVSYGGKYLSFATAEEARAQGDAWLRAEGCRLQGEPNRVGDEKPVQCMRCIALESTHHPQCIWSP